MTIKTENYNLFLDDERVPSSVSWMEIPDNIEWTIVRTYSEFVAIIIKCGLPNSISFDHDLGNSAYKEFFRAHAGDKIINYGNIREQTGYDCAKWLAQYCIDNKVPIPQYYLHSKNYIGCENIRSILESARKVIAS